jgi:hypothetical protein
MASPGQTYVVYMMGGHAVDLDLSNDRQSYDVIWIDSGGGATRPFGPVDGGSVVSLAPPVSESGRPWVAWLRARHREAHAGPRGSRAAISARALGENSGLR